MSYSPELQQLKDRFLVFTQKLKARAIELEQEASASAQMVYDEDDDHFKRTYGKFKAGIEGQFRKIIEKATDVFDTQIRSHRNSADKDFSKSIAWYSEMQDYMNNFEKEMYQMMRGIFDKIVEISPEVYLQEILEEYEEIKDAFHCKQCSANLTIDQMYFVSTYITCPYCQTQNTFVPGSRMQMLQHLSRDIAEERLKPLKEEIEKLEKQDAQKVDRLKSYLIYRAFVWLEKSKIVPVFKDEYSKVFYREIYEQLYDYNAKEIKIQPLTYEVILSHLGFNNLLKPQIIAAHRHQNLELFLQKLKDWELLHELSSFLMLNLYQGVEQKPLHDKHFNRIQEEWTLLTQCIKALESKEQSMEDVIKTLEDKF